MSYQLGDATFEFTQDADSDAEHDAPQALTVRICDAGAGHFFVIETARWAFEDTEELAMLITEVRKRLGDWWQ